MGAANAIVQLHWDEEYEGVVLLVAGMRGDQTRLAAEWLASKILDGTILDETCQAFILRTESPQPLIVTVVEKIYPT